MANSKRHFTMADLQKSKVAAINKEAMSPTLMSETSDNCYRLLIDPKGKPRMVKSDAWKKRKCVLQYWAWKDQLVAEATRNGLSDLPGRFKVTFSLPMPDSWSKSKRSAMEGKPHQQKFDLDNLLKALQDCLCKSDSHIYEVHAIKRWSYTGWIKIELI